MFNDIPLLNFPSLQPSIYWRVKRFENMTTGSYLSFLSGARPGRLPVRVGEERRALFDIITGIFQQTSNRNRRGRLPGKTNGHDGGEAVMVVAVVMMMRMDGFIVEDFAEFRNVKVVDALQNRKQWASAY